MAKLKITNTGEGIAQEMIDHVFDRFARGKNAQSKTEGCGLGLTIAQWIVHAHGGTIRLLDEGGGKTTALVRLPAESDVGLWVSGPIGSRINRRSHHDGPAC